MPSTVPGFAGVPGKWCPQESQGSPLYLQYKTHSSRGFQDGSIQREFQVGSPNRLVSYLGRLLGGDESCRNVQHTGAGDISGSCSSYGQGRSRKSAHVY